MLRRLHAQQPAAFALLRDNGTNPFAKKGRLVRKCQLSSAFNIV